MTTVPVTGHLSFPDEKPKRHISVSPSPSLALLSFLYTGFTQKLSQKCGESVHQSFRLTFYQLGSFRERISFTKVLVNILRLNVMSLARDQELTSSPRGCEPQLYQQTGEQRMRRFPKGTSWYCYQTKGGREREIDVFYPLVGLDTHASWAFLEWAGGPQGIMGHS